MNCTGKMVRIARGRLGILSMVKLKKKSLGRESFKTHGRLIGNKNFFFGPYSAPTLEVQNKVCISYFQSLISPYKHNNVLNMYVKLHFHPFHSEKNIFEYLPKIYTLCCPGNQSNSAIWTKFITNICNNSINISMKTKSKYPN